MKTEGTTSLMDIDQTLTARGVATFHCRETEHVGKGKNRHVEFLADKDCLLIFGTDEVFGERTHQLYKGKEESISVKEIDNVGTDLDVSIDGVFLEKRYTREVPDPQLLIKIDIKLPPEIERTPPQIFVP